MDVELGEKAVMPTGAASGTEVRGKEKEERERV